MFILKSCNKNILSAGRILRAGGVIVYSTDTAYALGGIFDNKKVIKKVLKIKQRKDDKFTLIASSSYQVEKHFKLNSVQKKLAKKFWPGPLSLVVSKKYAVRVPNNSIARKLARLAGKPLIATSANIHGKKTSYNIKNVLQIVGAGLVPAQKVKKDITPNLILDAGTLPKRKTSTIVEVKKNKIHVIREGAIKMK